MEMVDGSCQSWAFKAFHLICNRFFCVCGSCQFKGACKEISKAEYGVNSAFVYTELFLNSTYSQSSECLI